MNAVVANQNHAPAYHGPNLLNGFQRPTIGTPHLASPFQSAQSQHSPLQLLNRPFGLPGSNGSSTAAAAAGSTVDTLLNSVQRAVEQVLAHIVEQVVNKLLGGLEQSLGGGDAQSSALQPQADPLAQLQPDPAFSPLAGSPNMVCGFPTPFNLSVNQSNTQTVAPQQAADPAKSDSIFSVFGNFVETLSGIGEKLGPIWNGVKDIFGGGKDALGGLWSKASGLLGGVGGWIAGLF